MWRYYEKNGTEMNAKQVQFLESGCKARNKIFFFCNADWV